MRDKTIYVKWEQSTVTFTFVKDSSIRGSISTLSTPQTVDSTIGLASDEVLWVSSYDSNITLKVGNNTAGPNGSKTDRGGPSYSWNASTINSIANKDNSGHYLDTTFTVTLR